MAVPLRPQQSFTVVRQLANHLDSGTYYVRAVVRNAYTDAIIETLDLDDKGSQRFSKNWRTPADPSGQGFYISIVTSVYGDSGYASKSENYGDEENTHLIEARALGGGGGMSAGGVDARTVRRIMQEEIEKAMANLPEPPEAPEPPEFSFDEVLSALSALEKRLMEALPSEFDPSMLIAGLQAVLEAVEAKEVTPETDLTPVIEEVRGIVESTRVAMQNVSAVVAQGQDQISASVIAGLAKQLKGIKFKIAPSTAEMALPEEAQKGTEEPEIDISRLTT